MVSLARRPTPADPAATPTAPPAAPAQIITLSGATGPRHWPALREELRLHHGPADADGQPSWTVQDPVRHRYLRIDWTTYEVMRHWWMGDAATIAREVSRRTLLQLDTEDVLAVLAELQQAQLLQPTHPPAPPQDPQAPQARAPLRAALTWLLHHYLFFRIPLLRPEGLLRLLLPIARGLGHRRFTQLSWLAALAGGVLAVQQRELLAAQWLDLMSWRGLLLYGLTLTAVKLAHELGHALVARHHGCRVPTMGVAFMVMWPMAYTDTTDAWRLAQPRARLQIAAAGVRTELTLAAWATLAWGLLPEGPWRTAAFMLATMTWVSSVLINLSPFMRFDGYFLLCDALDLPNLHERSFALARHALRRSLLGWRQPLPEPVTAGRRRALVAFALATWGYRLVLFLGIAWMVYHFGPKLLGLLLFAVEIAWFIVGPVTRELAVWARGWAEWRTQPRAWLSLALLGLAGWAGTLPWSSSLTGAALLQPAGHVAVHLPQAAQVDALAVAPGQTVAAGQPLLQASLPGLQQQRQSLQSRIRQLQREVELAALLPERQGQWPALQAALATAREQAEALRQDAARLQPVAPFDAVVVSLHPDLAPGRTSPPPQEALMHLATPGRWQAVAYVGEDLAGHLQAGQDAWLVLDAQPWTRLPARVRSVAPQPSATLPEVLLVQAHGGLVDARETRIGWVPVQPRFRVELDVPQAPPGPLRQWRGHVQFDGPPLSVWQRLHRQAHALWRREAGF
ncbi:site-2 protease family protein [Ideonella livida]|uniref:HlyD family efflux transporter periplasmic adaptor subunit n=1 Tax=Ideonella livida TaxID=2707176 RepID=A0A7C9TMQ4_9BURK|nr:HlyD family efflux transporter periplasmic adaptor subunit [Ideonella livida]NDY93404.1 HlyD family efflux transporter periplasmic adaptor subunit [Ideonella livida]